MLAAPLRETDIEVLARALDLIVDIGDRESDALRQLPLRLGLVAAGSDLVRQHDRPKEFCLIVEGFACRHKYLSNGQRQILSFHFAGDVPDLLSLYLERMDHGLFALTKCRVAYIPHAAIHELIRDWPNLAAALWKSTLIDGSIFREWMASVGRRPAGPRMAHLFCEIFLRMKVLGIAHEQSFHLPLTQTDMGDALGLSAVHINRTLQELRREGLITSVGRYFAVENWSRLKAYADFDPAYLHLRRPPPEP